MQINSVLIFVPTYNERENIPLLYKELKHYCPQAHILFCDDNSPDGTGKVLDDLCQQDTAIKVMHRPSKLGLGTAHKAGFIYACDYGYDAMITMDADFTHHPKYIPMLLEHLEKADIVIGSRYAQGATMRGWGTFRLPFTLFWRSLIKIGLGMPYDCTGAYRAYRIPFLEKQKLDNLRSKGFSFGMEALYHFKRSGACINEVPIVAQSRIHGESKLSIPIMYEVHNMFWILLFDRLFR